MQARDALAALETGCATLKLGREVRAAELFERALVAADADPTLPRDSLLVVVLLDAVAGMRLLDAEPSLVSEGAATIVAAQDTTASAAVESAAVAWRTHPRALAASQRALTLLLARFTAGTLFAPLTPVEQRALGKDAEAHRTQQLQEDPGALPWQRADKLICVASDAVQFWPPLSDSAAEEARLRGVAAAVRALLTLHAHGVMHNGQHNRGCQTRLSLHAKPLVPLLLSKVLDEDAASGGLLHKLRVTCALTREEEKLLHEEVMPLFLQHERTCEDAIAAQWQTFQRCAAADVARHGLRACALPGCGATEPQPKTFKVCSRCRRACYCSPAHQAQDWRRHKREDACAAASPS
jgi:hypothetical protein